MSYEWALISCFHFEKPYIEGFFGEEFNTAEVVEISLEGLLMHPYWCWSVEHYFGSAAELTGLDVLRRRMTEKIEQS